VDFADAAPQMSSITKHLDEMGKAAAVLSPDIDNLEEIIKALTNQGLTTTQAMAALGAAMNTASATTSQAAQSIGTIAPSLAATAQTATSAATPIANVTAALAPIPQAAQAAATSTQQLQTALLQTSRSANLTIGQVRGLLNSVLEFTGITLSVAALKSFISESINVYAATERAQFGIAQMRGSASEAAATIDELKKTSMDLAVPFTSLVEASQKMAAFGFSSRQTTEAIHALADASAVLPFSFQQVANSLENIAFSGMAGARQLRQLGINSEDLAKVMGVSVEAVSKDFKRLTEATRVGDLIEAMDKFSGSAEKAAELTSGSLIRMQNAWTLALNSVGEALAPALTAVAKWVTEVAFTFEIGVRSLRTFVQEIKGLGQAAADVMTHNYGLAAVELENLRKLDADALKEIQGLIAAHEKAAEVISKPEHVPQIKIAEPVAAQKAAFEQEEALAKTQLEIRRLLYEEDAKERGLTQAQQLAQLQAFNKQEYDIVADGIAKKIALERQAGNDEAVASLGTQLQAAKDKLATEDVKAAIKVSEEKRKTFEQTVKDHVESLNKELSYEREISDHIRELNVKLEEDRTKADEEAIKGAQQHSVRVLESQRKAAEEEASLHQITAFQKLAVDRQLDAQEEAIERAAIAREIALLDNQYTADTNYASKRQALENQLQSLQDKRLTGGAKDAVKEDAEAYKVLGVESDKALTTQIAETAEAIDRLRAINAPIAEINAGLEKQLELEIKLALQRGQDASGYIAQLALIQTQMKAQEDASKGLGAFAVDAQKTFNDAFDKIGAGLANAATAGKNFDRDMRQVFKSIESEATRLVASTVFSRLRSLIVGLLPGGQASSGTLDALKSLPQSSGAFSAALSPAAGAAGFAGTSAGGTAVTTAIATQTATLTSAITTSSTAIVTGIGTEITTATSAIIAAITAAGAAESASSLGGGILGGLLKVAPAIPLAASGADVLSTGMAVIHAGEKILNKDEASGYRAMQAGGGGSGSYQVGEIHVHAHGVTDPDVFARTIAKKLPYYLKSTGNQFSPNSR